MFFIITQNTNINSKEVRIVGDYEGIYSLNEALELAEKEGLDLIQVNDSVNPPICKIMDYNKYIYEQKKAKNKNKQKTIKIKEIKFNYGIGNEDIKVKAKNAVRILNEKDRVKLIVVFKGREQQFINTGKTILESILEEISKITTYDIVSPEKINGNTYSMVIGPHK